MDQGLRSTNYPVVVLHEGDLKRHQSLNRPRRCRAGTGNLSAARSAAANIQQKSSAFSTPFLKADPAAAEAPHIGGIGCQRGSDSERKPDNVRRRQNRKTECNQPARTQAESAECSLLVRLVPEFAAAREAP
jgi:hypothetical protein